MIVRKTILAAATSLIAVASPFLAPAAPPTVSVTLAWDASTSTVAGYHVYEGVVSHAYTTSLDAGNSTNATVSGLVPGTTYYFAVAAYDVTGLESPLSSEISYPVPLVSNTRATVHLTVNAAKQASLGGTAPAGYVYDVQTSQNLTNWTRIGSVTADLSGSIQYTAPSATNSRAFFRLRQTWP